MPVAGASAAPPRPAKAAAATSETGKRATVADAAPRGSTGPALSGRRTDALSLVLQRAVQQRPNAPGRGAVLARKYMPTVEDFRQLVTGLSDDGTLKQLDKRLRAYRKLDDKRGGPGEKDKSNDLKRIQTARLIESDAARWLAAHPNYLGSTATAVRDLQANAKREADHLERKALRRHDKDAATVKEHIKARDMESAFKVLAPVINAVVPTSGSKAEVEAEIELAVDPNMVGYIGLRVKLEADRPDDSKLKIRAEATLTGGVKVPNVGRARFELGGYLEAQGRNADEVCRLISYALYRSGRRNPVCPRWIVNKLWGGDWDTDPGFANAERWAGAVETGVLEASGDNYVEMGAMVGAMAELGFQAGVVAAKAKVLAQSGMGERWDAKSIKTIHQEKSRWSDQKITALATILASNTRTDPHTLYPILAKDGIGVSVKKLEQMQKKARALKDPPLKKIEDIVREASPSRERPALGEASEFEGTFGSQLARGERTFWVKASGEADISIANMGLKAEIAFQSRGRDKAVGTHMREGKIEGRFGVKLPLNKALSPGLLQALEIARTVNAIENYIRSMQTIGDEKKTPKKDQASRGIGSGLRAAGDLGAGLSQLQAIGSKPFEYAGKAKSAIDPGISGFVLLGVIIEVKFKPSHADGSLNSYEITLSIVQEKGFKFEADLAAVAGRVAAKTQDRWVRIQIKDDGKIQTVTKDFDGIPKKKEKTKEKKKAATS